MPLTPRLPVQPERDDPSTSPRAPSMSALHQPSVARWLLGAASDWAASKLAPGSPQLVRCGLEEPLSGVGD